MNSAQASQQQFRLSGIAIPRDAGHMLTEICEHFVEHADVQRTGDRAVLTSRIGSAEIRIEDNRLLIELECLSPEMLQMSRTSIAEHMFYFAGEDPLELSWSEPAERTQLSNIHPVTVVSVEDLTPHMRRVKFACADVRPFIGGDMHARLLVPPKGRMPVWPRLKEDGRVGWPEGEDALLVRVYTIRFVDTERGELWVDFLQHPLPGIETPGADFARDARPGDKAALLGPGGGAFPSGERLLLAGDESALPAIARIVEEAPAGTRIEAIIEVENEAEEQPLPSKAEVDVRWLHRRAYSVGDPHVLRKITEEAIGAVAEGTFIWVACEKDDIRSIKARLKAVNYDRKKTYIAWYWERTS